MITQEALRRYGRHDVTCPLVSRPNLFVDTQCACGFSQALLQSQSQKENDPWVALETIKTIANNACSKVEP